MASHKVLIYTTPSCVYCRMAKQFLKDKGVAYVEHDVTADPAKAQEMIDKSGQMGVPVIEIDGQVIVGFDRTEMEELLGL